jgi:hypothetical protein
MTAEPESMPPIEPHAVPTVDELLEAVEECLRDELLPEADGRTNYLLRVSVAALSQVRRELALGAQIEETHRRRLDLLGVADDLGLAAEIRAGGLDPARHNEIVLALRERVADQLRVVAPSRPSGSQ